jgi:heme/copper-type cytochrome/quinol oxidase subunit 1
MEDHKINSKKSPIYQFLKKITFFGASLIFFLCNFLGLPGMSHCIEEHPNGCATWNAFGSLGSFI